MMNNKKRIVYKYYKINIMHYGIEYMNKKSEI